MRSASGSCSKTATCADVSMILAEDRSRHSPEYRRVGVDRPPGVRHLIAALCAASPAHRFASMNSTEWHPMAARAL
jgi:hypothetical protein